jgi:hypothetical protein
MKLPRRVLGWTMQSSLSLRVQRKDGTILQVMIVPIEGTTMCGVLAIETTAASLPKPDVQAVLDHHAHQDLGKVEGIVAAMELAEKYVTTWKKMRMEHPECSCDDIETASRGLVP